MRENKKIEGMPTGINSQSNWIVKGDILIRNKDGTERKIQNGIAMQTPELFDKKEVKIISNGQEIILKGEKILALVDGNGNVFW